MPVPPGGAYPALSRDLPQAQAFERELFEDRGYPAGRAPVAASRCDDIARRRVNGSRAVPVSFTWRAGSPRGGGRSRACRHHRARALPLPVRRRNGAAPRDPARIPAPRAPRRCCCAAPPARRLVIAESTGRRHGDRARTGVLRGGRGPRGDAKAPLAAQAVRGDRARAGARRESRRRPRSALRTTSDTLPGAACFGRLRGEFLNILHGAVAATASDGACSSRAACGSALIGRTAKGFSRAAGPRADDDAEGRRRRCCSRRRRCGSRFERPGCSRATPAADARAGRTGRPRQRRATATCVAIIPPAYSASRTFPFRLVGTGDVLARALSSAGSKRSARSRSFRGTDRKCRAGDAVGRALPTWSRTSVVVSMVEGWRGEIVHVAVTAADGGLAAYKIVRSVLPQLARAGHGDARQTRSRTFRCATRASICPTLDTTCEEDRCAIF